MVTEYGILAEYAGGTQWIGQQKPSRAEALEKLSYVRKHKRTAVRFYLVERGIGGEYNKLELLEERPKPSWYL